MRNNRQYRGKKKLWRKFNVERDKVEQTSVVCFDEIKKSTNGKENNELKVVMKKHSSEIKGSYSQYEKSTMLFKKKISPENWHLSSRKREKFIHIQGKWQIICKGEKLCLTSAFSTVTYEPEDKEIMFIKLNKK